MHGLLLAPAPGISLASQRNKVTIQSQIFLVKEDGLWNEEPPWNASVLKGLSGTVNVMGMNAYNSMTRPCIFLSYIQYTAHYSENAFFFFNQHGGGGEIKAHACLSSWFECKGVFVRLWR